MKFSLVIASRNRPEQLKQCLAAIRDLDYPREEFEVIVVDDGSHPALEAAAPVRLLRQEHAGPAAARNTGAQHAAGEVLVFTDDDCRPRPDWLREIDRRVQPGTAIGGRVLNGLPQNPYAEASQAIHDFVYRDERHFNTSNFAVTRADFLSLGGFDITWRLAAAEDFEFCERWRAAGNTLEYAPEAAVEHFHYMSLAGFWGQHFGYGRGAFWLRSRHALRRPVSFQWNLVRYAFRRGDGTLVVAAQVATLAGFLRQLVRGV